MGWKTITGTVLIAVGVALGDLPFCIGACHTVSQVLVFAGTILGGVGIRSAISKVSNK